MKYLIGILLYVFLTQAGICQDARLDFSWSVTPYDSLSYSESQFVFNDPWGSETEYIEIGFDFKWFGHTYSIVKITTPGFFEFFQKCITESNGDIIFPFNQFRDPAFEKGDSVTASPIIVALKGSTGERTFIVEYKNLATSFSLEDSVNFQIALHEKNNSISYKFGKIKFDQWEAASLSNEPDTLGFNFPAFSFFHTNCQNFFESYSIRVYYNKLSEEYEDSIVVLSGGVDTEKLKLFKIPERGTTFFFDQDYSTSSTINKSTQFKDIVIFPNPSSGTFRLRSLMPETTNIEIFSSGGNQIPFTKSGDQIQMDRSIPGIYILKITQPRSIVTRKIIIVK